MLYLWHQQPPPQHVTSRHLPSMDNHLLLLDMDKLHDTGRIFPAWTTTTSSSYGQAPRLQPPSPIDGQAPRHWSPLPPHFSMPLPQHGQPPSSSPCYLSPHPPDVQKLLFFMGGVFSSNAGDPDITSDFVVPNGITLDANFFTFRGLKQSLWGAPKDVPFKVTKASLVEFPALEGQSVSYATLQFAPNGVNPPHTHPRSAELLLVTQGWLEVGFVDTNNTLFTQVLQTGEMFVFPKGLVHFQVNKDPRYPAVALSAFGSANAGTLALPKILFGSGISKDVLAKSFKTDVATIGKLVSAATMS